MWFRRDLRLADNPALMAALEHAGPRGEVMALYVLDPNLLRYAGEPRKAYLFETLRALNAQLDGQLVVRTGSPVDVLHEVAQDKHVFASADFGPYGRLRDEDVSASGIHI